MAKKTDLQVLRAVLGLPDGKIPPSERKSFRGMYDQLVAGMMISLSKKQRAWVDAVYAKHDLDRERPPVTPLPPSGKKP